MTAERLRVFQLIKSLGRGGAEILLPETLQWSDRDRFSYRYGYFLPWKTAMVESLVAQGAQVTCFGASNNLSILLSANRVARQLRHWRAHLLHCHLPIAGVVGRIAGKLAGVPVVYTEHNTLDRYHVLTRRLNLSTWGWQARAIAVSSDVARSLRVHADPRVPIDIVLNGVNVQKFDRQPRDSARLRKQLGIPLGAPVVGTVAVFRLQKALDDWLRSASMLRDLVSDVRFVLVGDGPLREELQEQAHSLGLDDSLHWAGLRKDVRPYLSLMDVYWISSVFEGLPIALLEAMAMRCAVVSTDVGGIPEVIEQGRNGFLVEPRRPDRLAEVTQELIREPERREQVGDSARRTVNERFSIQRMTRELESIYLRVSRDNGDYCC